MDPKILRPLISISVWVICYYLFYKPAVQKNRAGWAWWVGTVIGFFMIVVGVSVAGISHFAGQPGARDLEQHFTPETREKMGYASIVGIVLAMLILSGLHFYLKRLPVLEAAPNSGTRRRTTNRVRGRSSDDSVSKP